MTDFFRSLRPASFRGITFLMEDGDIGGGRRYVTHEFPGRDEPQHEDLGATVKELTVRAIIQGADYISRSKSLEAALNAAGAASLMHPFDGEIQVAVMSYRKQMSTSLAGEITFSITFQKFGAPSFPRSVTDSGAGLFSSGKNAFSSVLGNFKNSFSISGMPDFMTDALEAVNSGQLSVLQSALSKTGLLEHLIDGIPGLSILTGSFADDIVALYQSLVELVTPGKTPIIGNTKKVSPPPRSLVTGLSQTAKAPNGTASIDRNSIAIDLLHKGSAAAAAASAVRLTPYDSREDALQIRDNLGQQISDLRDRFASVGWDASWQSFGDLEAALSTDLKERIGRLPVTTRVRPTMVKPTLVIANSIYGDDQTQILAKADDIAKRNRIRHPGFVPVKDLEVIVDAL